MKQLSNREITDMLTAYKNLYDGKYWNKGLKQSQLSESNWGVTGTGCPKDNPGSCDNCTSNKFLGIQCHGFAKFLEYVLFGDFPNISGDYTFSEKTKPSYENWEVKDPGTATPQPGDFVRVAYGRYVHSFVIWSVADDHDTVQVAECLGSLGCYLHWGNMNLDRNYASFNQMKRDGIIRYIVRPKVKKADTVTVTYVSDNSTYAKTENADPATVQVSVEDPSAEGRVFKGWLYNGKTYFKGDAIDGVTGNITLTAHWVCMLTFDANGGQVFCENGSTLGTSASITVDLGKSHTITYAAFCEGRKFIGWKKKTTDPSAYLPGHTLPDLRQNTTLYADWEERTCVITYKTSDGSAPAEQIIRYGECEGEKGGSLKIPSRLLQTPESDFYDFNGWKIENGKDDVLYQPGGEIPLPEFRNYTLIASETPRVVAKVTYDANGGSQAPEAQEIRYGQTINLRREEPFRWGFTFFGWSETKDGQPAYAPGAAYASGVSQTLYAKWVSGDYVIHFDTDAHPCDPSPTYKTPLSGVYRISGDNRGMILPDEIPVREGYRFAGWKYDGEMYQPKALFRLSDWLFSHPLPEGGNKIRLIAAWEPCLDRPILFTDLKGDHEKKDRTFPRIARIGNAYSSVFLPGDASQKAAFPDLEDAPDAYFDGWADESGTYVSQENDIPKKGFDTLYAQWVPKMEVAGVSGDTNKAISRCFHYGYMQGTGTADPVCPTGQVSRKNVATVLYRMAGCPKVGNNRFYDIKTDAAGQAVSWAADNGVVTGVTEYTFRPSDPVTREQMVTMLFRYAQLALGRTLWGDDSALAAFEDRGEISCFALRAIKWAVSSGILCGVTPNTISPKGTLTRSQLAAFTVRLRDYLLKKRILS